MPKHDNVELVLYPKSVVMKFNFDDAEQGKQLYNALSSACQNGKLVIGETVIEIGHLTMSFNKTKEPGTS